MIVHGREIHLAFTAGAMDELAKLCPGGNIRRMGELFDVEDENKPLDMGLLVKMIAILSDWGEKKMRYETPGYERRPFTVEELGVCDVQTIRDIFTVAMAQIHADSAQTVETEPAEKPGKKTEATENP